MFGYLGLASFVAAAIIFAVRHALLHRNLLQALLAAAALFFVVAALFFFILQMLAGPA